MSAVQTKNENESYTMGTGVEIHTVYRQNGETAQIKSEFCIK